MKRLLRIEDRYYYRLVIPKDLIVHFPFKREIKKSLKTANFRNAKHLAGIYNAEADKLFTMIRGNNAMTDQEIKRLVNDFTASILSQNEEGRLERGHQVTEYGSHLESNIPYSEISETVQREMIDATFTEVKRLLENYLEEQSIDIDLDRDSIEYKKLLKEASHGYLESLEVDKRRDLLDYSDTRDSQGVPSAVSGASSGPTATPTIAETPKPPEKAYRKCSEIVKLYLDHQEKEGNVNSKTLGEERQILERFMFIKSDKPVNLYGVSDFDEYKDILSRLPDRMGNKTEYKGKSVEEVLAMDYEKTVAIRTMRKHITTVKKFFQWTLVREHSDVNSSGSMRLPKIPKSAPRSRLPYDVEDLERMVEGYSTEYADARDFKKRADWFYIPWIAVYTGMRQNEICQLGIDDLLQDERSGVWYFNVYEEEGKTQVKNKPSIRKVPVHPALIELGLLEYHRKTKNQGHPRLWPLLNRGADDKYSKSIQNFFNGSGDGRKGFRQRYISEDPRKVFHCFRNTLRNELKQVRADTDVCHEIVGHEYEEGESGTYTEDYAIDVKLKELSKVTYNDLDLSSLKPLADSYL